MNQGIMLNIDGTHFTYSRFQKGIAATEQELRGMVSKYQGTQVTDLVFCSNERLACYPSQVITDVVEKYLQKEENALPVDYSDTYFRLYHDMYVKQNLDAYALWLQECKAIGIRGWLSLRMNDCHENFLPTSLLHSDFFHQHPEYRRITHRTVDGYYDRCLDYAEPAVRELELALVSEILERYDPDGVELDFQREAFCFRPGGEHEGIEILNGFMRQVSQIIAQAARLRGHDILLGVRVPADPEDCLELGMDVSFWAQEGLVQVVSPAPRWSTCDCDMPVELWKRLLKGSGALLCPGIELLIQPGSLEHRYTTQEHVLALAHQHFSLGADKTYLFNYYDDPSPEDTFWSNPQVAHPDMAVAWEKQMHWLHIAGDPDLTAQARRSHLISERDLRPPWRKTERLLPLCCSTPGEFSFRRVPVGSIPAGAPVILKLGLSQGRPEDLEIYVHRRPAILLGKADIRPAFFTHDAFAFSIENDGTLPPYLVLEIASKSETAEIDYIEIQVG